MKNVPRNRTNDGLFFMKQAQITRKSAKYLKRVSKISIFKLSENRIISQQLFLNPNFRVKWRGRDCENIHTTMAESTEHSLLLFAQIDH